MGSQTSVGVRLEPDSAKAGDEVSGTVFLQVAEDTSATHIDVQVIGREKTKVKYTQKSGKSRSTRTAHEESQFLLGRWTLETFQGDVARAGRYQYPFSCSLPQYMGPGSIQFTSDASEFTSQSNSCEVQYLVSATLHKQGVGWFTSKLSGGNEASTPLFANISVPPPQEIKPAFVKSSIQINLCGCFSKGNISLQAAVDKDAFMVGEPFAVLYEASNFSSVDITEVVVTIHEELRWTAKSHAKVVNRTESQSFPAHKLNRTGEMVLPNRFQPSFHGRLVTCRHAVTVTLTTAFGYSNPSVRIPIWVFNAHMAEPIYSNEVDADDSDGDTYSLQKGPSELPSDWVAQVGGPVKLGCVPIVPGALMDVEQQARSQHSAGASAGAQVKEKGLCRAAVAIVGCCFFCGGPTGCFHALHMYFPGLF